MGKAKGFNSASGNVAAFGDGKIQYASAEGSRLYLSCTKMAGLKQRRYLKN